jgi:phage FluMu gp28-like protein
MPLDAEKLRRALDDPDAWAQEYECEPMDSSSVLLPYDLIASCESMAATTSLSAEFWESGYHLPIFMGLDFARKRDLSVAWSNAKLGDIEQTLEVLEMAKMSTPRQVELLRPRIKRAQRISVDYTGPGVGMGDYLVEEFGEWDPARHLYGKVELVTFSNPVKVDLFSKLRMGFENRRFLVPISRVIREDLHSINRVTTSAGTVTYRAPHTEDGHADRSTALALAHRAASGIQTEIRLILC